MTYDSTCKFIAAQFSEDMAKWLLGKPISLTELKPSELSLEPIRADSLIFLQSDNLILHIEFQTQPDKNIPFRMLDYRIRGYRLYPQKEMIQVVIYLRESPSEWVQKNVFELQKTRHEFEVIRLWEVSSETLLQSKGLWPFAILSQNENRENLLRQISQKIEDIPDRREKSNVAASTAILSWVSIKSGNDSTFIKRGYYERICYLSSHQSRRTGTGTTRRTGTRTTRRRSKFNFALT